MPAKKPRAPKLPIGCLYLSEWNNMSEEQQRDFNFKHGQPVHGCYLVMTSLCHQNTQSDLADLHRLVDRRNAEVGKLEKQIHDMRKGLLDEMEKLQCEHRSAIRKLEDAHSQEVLRMRAVCEDWRGRFSSAKLFICTLLRGDL